MTACQAKRVVGGLAAFLCGAGFAGSAAAAPCTWTGATSGNWSEPANWSCAGGPATGADLVFPEAGANKAMTQDIPAFSVNSIAFSGAGGGYALSGAEKLIVTGAAALTSRAEGTNANTLGLTSKIYFGAPVATIDTSTGADGKLFLNGPLDLNGSVLDFVWDITVPYTFVNGAVSGTGGLSVSGVGGDLGLTLSGDNSFEGPVTVNGGYLVVNHPHALGLGGTSGNGTTVASGGTLVLNADTASEHLTLIAGSGSNGNGMVQANGTRVWGGPVTLDAAIATTVRFALLGSKVTFTAPVGGNGGIACCSHPNGTVALASVGNTYSGPSDFDRNAGGTLRLLADGALSPNSAITVGGSTGGTLDMGAFSGSAAAFTGASTASLEIAAGQKLQVAGAVALDNTTLVLGVPGTPAVGTVYTILEKTGAGPITGTFAGLPEGATLDAGGYAFKISYAGGTGNDVTLAVVSSAVSVSREGSGTGYAASDVGLIDCGAVCADTYPDGTLLTLKAVPDMGSEFTGWLGPCTGTGLCTFVVTGPTAASATFAPSPIPKFVLDVDGDGNYDAMTDGLLILRYLFGMTGPGLVDGAVVPGAPRDTSALIVPYLNDIRPLLDVDGDGRADALTDGLLIIRYLLGLTGDALIDHAVGPGAIRADAQAIEPYIQGLRP